MIYPAEERRAQHNVNKTAEGKLLWKKDKEGDPRLMGARQGKKCKEDFQDFARQHGQRREEAKENGTGAKVMLKSLRQACQRRALDDSARLT